METKKQESLNLDGVSNNTEAASKVSELENRVDPEVEKAATENVKKLMDFNLSDLDRQEAIKASVESIGLDIEKENAKFSPMLQQTISRVSRDTEGGEVAKALVDLKMQVEELDPSKFDFSPGSFSRIMGYLPFIGTPIKKYFTKYESAQTVIAAIMTSLQKGKEELERDNKTLAMDQKRMRELTKKLTKAIDVIRMMDEQIAYKVEREMTAGSEEVKFVQEQVLFPLRQRAIDLQQTLAVNQQGVLALEVVIQNNKELIKGAVRTETVTKSALDVAVTVALALSNQKIVLDKINGIKATTNNLIKGTAARLKTQGTEIQKNATEAALDMDALKTAFQDIHSAMDDLSKFKTESLVKMNTAITEMAQMTTQADEKIREMEKGRKVREKIIDLEVK